VTGADPIPLLALRRRIMWLQIVGVLAVLVPGLAVWGIERERARIRERSGAFFEPTLEAAQEALMAIDDLRMAPARGGNDPYSEAARQRQFYRHELELRLERIFDLQRAYQWPEASATVARLEAMWNSRSSTPSTGADLSPAGPDVDELDQAIDQLRLLHKYEQRRQLDQLDAIGRRFRGVILPLIVVVLACGAAVALVVWRSIAQGIATEWALRNGLAESEARLRLALSSARQGFYDLDLVSGRAVTSPDYASMIGEDPSTFEETTERWLARLHPEDRESVYHTYARYLAGETQEFAAEFRQRKKDGDWLWTQSMGRIVARDAEGKPLRMLGLHTNVHSRKSTELALASSQKRLEQAQRIALIGNWEINLATGEVLWSDEVFRLFEVNPSEFAASAEAFRALIDPEDYPSVVAAYELALHDHQPYRIIYRIRLAGGRMRYIEEHCEIDVAPDGTARNSHGTVQDATQRILAKEELRSTLHEKEILLREIHHRVKNNLQIIASLLYFQSQKAEGREAAAVFQQARERLRSIILVHEKLYTSNELGAVDFADYARALVAQLTDSQSGGGSRVTFRVEANTVLLPIQTAMPSGMILVELVTNVLKYAFPPGESGDATVRVRSEGGRVTLEVEDNGAGFPEDFHPDSTGSFGWQLITNLTSQLAGTATVNREGGARVTVSFPYAPAA